jgi:hypothetical protein
VEKGQDLACYRPPTPSLLSKENVMRLCAILGPTLGFLFFATTLFAAELKFADETFQRKEVQESPEIRRAEYVRSTETLDNWTDLFAIRNFTQLTDPVMAVADFAATLKEQKPSVDATISMSDDRKIVMIMFVIASPDGKYAEFNLHRYLKRDGYPGLISYQFAHKVTNSPKDDQDALTKNMGVWIKAMSEADYEPDFKE